METKINDATVTKPRSGLYLVRRTSNWGEDIKPCDEAFKILFKKIDVRNTDDPKKIPAFRGTNGNWYELGTNHRVENGMIMRDMGTKTAWAIEISDIQGFVDKYGDCVVGRNVEGFCTIEIYDDHRE